MGRAQLIESIFSWYACLYSSCVHVAYQDFNSGGHIDQKLKLFWSGDIYSKKVCIVSLNSICLPWEVGDLDPKSSCYINESLVFHLSTTDIHPNGI